MYKRHTGYSIPQTLVGTLDFHRKVPFGNKRCKNACGKELSKTQRAFCSKECMLAYQKRLESVRIQVHLANKALH